MEISFITLCNLIWHPSFPSLAFPSPRDRLARVCVYMNCEIRQQGFAILVCVCASRGIPNESLSPQVQCLSGPCRIRIKTEEIRGK